MKLYVCSRILDHNREDVGAQYTEAYLDQIVQAVEEMGGFRVHGSHIRVPQQRVDEEQTYLVLALGKHPT